MTLRDSKLVVDVLCVGFACVDLNFNTDHHPEADEKLRATAMHTCGGGPAANAAVAIARLGGCARFCGYLGNDAFGDAHIREFEQENVLAGCLTRGEAPTPVATVIVKPNGCRANISYRSPQAVSDVDAISLSEYPAKVLLVDGHQPLLSLALIEEARRFGIPSILDAGSVSDGTMMLFNQVDYLVTSEKFARDYTGEDDPRTALAALDGSAHFIAITWGSGGVYWQDEYGQHHTPAFDIEAVDTNGAGDAFHGAFALGIAQGLKPKDNIRRSSAAGALTCLKVGARSALPALVAVSRLCGTV